MTKAKKIPPCTAGLHSPRRDEHGNSQPLVVEYGLGQEEAPVRFILVPKAN